MYHSDPAVAGENLGSISHQFSEQKTDWRFLAVLDMTAASMM